MLCSRTRSIHRTGASTRLCGRLFEQNFCRGLRCSLTGRILCPVARYNSDVHGVGILSKAGNRRVLCLVTTVTVPAVVVAT